MSQGGIDGVLVSVQDGHRAGSVPEKQTVRVKEGSGLDVDPELDLHDGQKLGKEQQQNNKQ